MRLAVIAFAVGLLASASAHAQTQMALNERADSAYRVSDADLNRQYRALTDRLSPEARSMLTDAQRSWLTFRDTECRFRASGVEGGSAYPLVYAGCLEELTRTRTRQLQQLLACEEGDMSCPR